MHERLLISKKLRGIAKAALSLAICLAMPIASLSASASENEVPDLDRDGSISINFMDPETKKPISGDNRIALYKVASVKTDNGYSFVYEDGFASEGEAPVTDEDFTADLAATLAQIAEKNSLTPDSPEQKIDANGNVTFTWLKAGLYLAVQSYKGKGDTEFTISPFLITIPNKAEDGSLIYDVDASPKVELKKHTTPPPTPPTPPRPPKRIPQTGQMWWPVLALSLAGVMLVGLGMIRKRSNR